MRARTSGRPPGCGKIRQPCQSSPDALKREPFSTTCGTTEETAEKVIFFSSAAKQNAEKVVFRAAVALSG